MIQKNNFERNRVHVWMFRSSKERLFLALSLSSLLLISIFIYSFNVFIFSLALIGVIVYVQLEQARYLGNSIRVHRGQFPEIYQSFKDQAEKLGIPRASLYIVQDPYLNAFALGITTCTVVLNSALVEQLTQRELDFIIAHELGHFKAGHTKITSLLVPVGSNNFFSNLVFGFWKREAEYTCDRCGLALSKDIDSAISALIKLAIGNKLYGKFNIEGYLGQLKSAQRQSVRISEVLGDHPLTTNRIKNIMVFWKENFIVKSQ